MDNKIRIILGALNQENDKVLLNEVYQLLKYGVEVRDDSVDAIQASWYVLTAEVAFERGYRALAKDCLEMFFRKSPPEDQFLGRGYLCQAQLNAPVSKKDTENLEVAVSYITRAINFARKTTRYHFLVYNASVIYWKFCRPFLTAGHRHHLSKSLHNIVKALDDIDDKDYEWRTKLLIALIECHIDAGRREDAINVAQVAASFTKSHIPDTFKDIFELQIVHRLADPQKLVKDAKLAINLNILYRMKRLRLTFEGKEVPQAGKTPVEQVDIDLGRLIKRILREEDSSAPSGRKSVTPGGSLTQEEQIKFLLELAVTCLEFDKIESAEECVHHLKKLANTPASRIQTEYLTCQLTIKRLGPKQELYTKPIVQARLKVIKEMESTISSAIRLKDADVIQTGCIVLWNLCLPFLQKNLRKNIKKSLTLIANALEQLDSLLSLLRCQIHIELAKCEEAEEQIQVALRHIQKAMALDDNNRYTEQLNSGLRRLRLRTELYQTPDQREDRAAQLIEQARSSDDSSTVKMKRALLVQAGQALSPDAFSVVLDCERDITIGKGLDTLMGKLATRANHWVSCLAKAKGHIKRMGTENDKERVRLWSDLAKLARKQEVWDVARVASTFCLLYDDGRWNIIRANDSSLETTLPKVQNLVATNEEITAHNNTELMRILAEVYCIHGEAYLCKSRDEGTLLGDSPSPPQDPKLKQKNQVTNTLDDPDWKTYCDWVKSLWQTAINDFKRALQLGCELSESWLVYSAAAYLWNYCKHKFDQASFREFVPVFQPVLTAMKTIGINGESVLYSEISYVLAKGIIQPWLPELPTRIVLPLEVEKGKGGGGGGGNTTAGIAHSNTAISNRTVQSSMTGSDNSIVTAGMKVPRIINIDPDATPELKQAMDIIENALTLTNGSNDSNKIPLSLRHKMLTLWVYLRQLLNINIPRNLSHEHDENKTPVLSASKAITAVEMISSSRNGLGEFVNCPTLNDAIKWVESANISWNDCIVELYLWSKLALVSLQVKNFNNVISCSEKGLKFGTRTEITSLKSQKIQECQFSYVYAHEMLSLLNSLLGQAYVETMGGRIEQRRLAMQAFVDSVRCAIEARSYTLAMSAIRHYWNTCLPLVKQPLERKLLIEPLTFLLESISDLYRIHNKSKADEVKSKLTFDQGDPKLKQSLQDSNQTAEEYIDDLTIRAAMYGVLFLGYADKDQYKEGLQAMDKAISHMPRTHHRLLIFKHRVIFKAKLGKNVLPDIAKFRDENERVIAEMWRYVAECSDDRLEQLSSYQNSIEVLKNSESQWQKFDYLLEFGCWLHRHLFPLQDAIDQFEWAADIILSMARSERLQIADAKQQKRKIDMAKLENGINTEDDEDDDDDDDELFGINPADYIPIKSEETIGIIPSEIPITAKDILQVKQLEALLRIHVIMALTCNRSSPKYRKYIHFAWTYLMRIWRLNQITASKTLHELALIQERQAEAKKAKDKNANKDSTKELQVLKLPKRKSNTIHPSAALPTTIDAWSTYELPDDFRNAIKNDTTGCGFNKISINKPMLTFQIMKDFLELCQQSGYHQLCPPLVSMMTLLAQDVIEHKTLISYSRLLSIQLYQDLNLVSGVKHHEQIAGDVVIDESEQAKSREEIHEWQEIQNRVELEGEKIAAKKKATVRFEDDYDDKPETTIKSVKNSIDIRNFEFNSTVAIKSLKIVIGNVSLRHLWTDTAELLIKQGRYQSARQYLTEAQFSAEVFDDKELMTRIYYNLAVILYREANIPHALAKLIDAQKNAVDKEMWLKTILCLVDVLLQDSYRKSQAKTVLLHSIGCLVELAEERKNEVNYITYVKALLTARLAALEMEESKEMENYSQLHATLITALEHYNTSIEDLKNEGFKREASKVLIEQGKLKNLLAKVASTTDDQHQYLLEALQSYEEAVQLSNDVYVDSTTLKPVLKPREANLPVQRESIQARLAFANHVIVIMITADAEDQQKRKLDARKDSVQRVFDEYVRPTPIPNSIDTIWKTAINTFTGKALTHLSIAHHLAGSSIKLKAEVLYAAGKSLRLKAFQANPSEVLPWNDLLLTNNQKNLLNNEVPDQKNDKDLYELSDGSISDQDEARDDKSELELEFGNRKYRAIRYLFNYGLSQNYLAQANDCVSQCVHLCLSHRHHDILSLAALEMVECCGRYDPLTTAQYLALHQSCAASQFLYETLMGAQRDPTASRQAALLQQRRHIKIASCDINEAISTTLQSNLDLLEVTSEAWKFISISPNHLDLMKDLPAGISCIILQHSPDKSVLYGAMLEKSKTATIKATKLSSQNLPINASVARADVSPIQLDNLLEKFDQYKKDLSAALVRWNRLEHIQQQQEKLISSFDGESDLKEAKEQQKFTAEEESLQANFNDLITDLDEYLSPILDKFDFIGRPGTGRTGTSNMSGPPGSSHTTGDFLVILADKELLRLPLEATSFFRSASVSSISRDFSLQILRHRLIDDEGREKREKRKPKVSDQIKPTTTSKRSDKKGKQQNLTERAPPANGLNINSSYVRYVVDTKNFGSDIGEFSPSQVMTSILKSRPAVTNRWYGLMGNDHAPSLGEWQRILLQSSAFIYYAYERCLADFSPKYLAPLNLPDCRLVVILDQAHSYQSFHNQAKIDAQKSVEELQLEEPLETAALFTLSGVGSVVINQWGTKLQQNKERIRQFIGGNQTGNKTVGQMVYALLDPVKEQKLLEQDLASSHKGSLDIAAAVEARRREEEENTNSVQLSYDWYNTVIYGLPNLIIN